MVENPYNSDTTQEDTLSLEIYLSEIDQEKLEESEEIKLCVSRELGLVANKYLDRKENIPQYDKERFELISEEGKEAERILIEKHQWLVVTLARRYDSLPLLDAIQEGNIGLIKAIDKYDCTRGSRLGQYAVWWISRELSKKTAEISPLIKTPVSIFKEVCLYEKAYEQLEMELMREPTIGEIAERAGLSIKKIEKVEKALKRSSSVGDILFGNTLSSKDTSLSTSQKELEDDIAEKIDNEINTKTIWKELKKWEKDEASIVIKRCGLDGEEPLSFREISKLIGITENRVRYIFNRKIWLLGRKIGHKYSNIYR